jgi:hypothetical protein
MAAKLFNLRWPIVVVAASIVSGLVVAVSFAEDTHVGRPPAEVGAADNTQPGTFSQAAADLVASYDKATVLWLGAEFAGLQLDRAKIVPYDLPEHISGVPGGRRVEVLSMIYGDCEARKTESGDLSCVPPLQIQVRTPQAFGTPERMANDARTAPPYSFRGVTALDNGTSTVLWFSNGVTVTIHSNVDIRAAVLQALRSANHERLGIPEVTPGEDIREFGSVVPPASP